jgi:hypothetical protein
MSDISRAWDSAHLAEVGCERSLARYCLLAGLRPARQPTDAEHGTVWGTKACAVLTPSAALLSAPTIRALDKTISQEAFASLVVAPMLAPVLEMLFRR